MIAELIVVNADGDGWREEIEKYQVTERGGLKVECTDGKEFHLSPQTNWQIHKFEE